MKKKEVNIFMDIQSLTKFYDRLYSDGKCSHYQECSKECKFQLNFYRGRIGSHYGEGIPKIFIVGREPVFPKNYNGEKISYSVTEPCTLADAGLMIIICAPFIQLHN